MQPTETIAIATPTGVNKINPIANPIATHRKLSQEQVDACDRSLKEFEDLITPDYFKWYCKMFNRIGEDIFRGLAKEARAGENPKRYFSYLLKKFGK